MKKKNQILPLQPEKYLMDEKLIQFLKEHHVMTISSSIDNIPYCAHCFYVFDEERKELIFTSDKETRHGKEFLQNKKVAVGIALETTMVGQIRGAQITGEVKMCNKKEEKQSSHLYLKRFPFAVLKSSELWIVKIEFLKFTDNRLGFGKKLIWNNSES